MKKNKINSGVIIIFMSCVMLVLMICYISIDVFYVNLGTSFGGTTGTIYMYRNIYYYSNYPEELGLEEVNRFYYEKKEHTVLDNMFDIPSGYEFDGWNDKMDGSGNKYVLGNVIPLNNDIELYAQWIKIEVKVIKYGDVDLDGVITENDVKLVLEHVSGVNVLTGDALVNADVNADSIINTVDVDILEQVLLGTEGYSGYLPDKPVPIYDFYQKKEEIDGSVDNNTDEDNNLDNGNGTGNVGNGTSNSNSSSENKKPSKPSTSKPSGSNNQDDTENKEEEIKTYKFIYVNKDKEYAVTTCNVSKDGNCELVIPNVSPSMDGYKFIGWSKDINCSNDSVFYEPMVVNSDNTYYACFKIEQVVNEEKKDNKLIYIIIIGIWILAMGLIFRLVLSYKNRKETGV